MSRVAQPLLKLRLGCFPAKSHCYYPSSRTTEGCEQCTKLAGCQRCWIKLGIVTEGVMCGVENSADKVHSAEATRFHRSTSESKHARPKICRPIADCPQSQSHLSAVASLVLPSSRVPVVVSSAAAHSILLLSAFSILLQTRFCINTMASLHCKAVFRQLTTHHHQARALRQLASLRTFSTSPRNMTVNRKCAILFVPSQATATCGGKLAPPSLTPFRMA